MNAPQEPEERDDAVIGRAFRLSLAVGLGAAALGAGAWFWLRPTPIPAPTRSVATPAPSAAAAPPQQLPAVAFTDVTAASGLRFSRFNGARGEKLLPETMGGGATFFDHDADGDPDLLLVNGESWPGDPAPATRPTPALYLNDGKGAFRDATSEAGLDFSFQGMGAAAADVDADGDPDLLLTGVHALRLLLQEGGRYVDRTREWGLDPSDAAWTTAAAFFDADQDGDLDLALGAYVQWERAQDLAVSYTFDGHTRAYGPPNNFRGSFPRLLRNEGGRFSDVSAASGLQVKNLATGEPLAKTLGLHPVDVDADGRLDLVLANDTVQNFLFRNLGGGRFEETGVHAGLAFDVNGRARGAMGLDSAFHRNDAALAVGIGNFANEMSALYVRPRPEAGFADLAVGEGIGAPSRKSLTFGLIFLDYDLDGRLDLLQANGHIEERIADFQAGQQYAQPAQLFWNTGAAPAFAEVPADRTGALAQPLVGRACATADIDLDGDPDVLVTQPSGPPRLVRNDQAQKHHWLRVRVRGKAPNTDALGAEVAVVAGGVRQVRAVMPFRGYLSQVELPLTFGLGGAAKVDELTVRWPDGTKRSVPVPGVDRVVTIEP